MWEDRIASLNSHRLGVALSALGRGNRSLSANPMNGTLGVAQHHPDGRVRCLPSSL